MCVSNLWISMSFSGGYIYSQAKHRPPGIGKSLIVSTSLGKYKLLRTELHLNLSYPPLQSLHTLE